MDPKIVEKINALAKSLKDNHLVANMEEGIEKAKEILGYGNIEGAGEAKKPEVGAKEEMKTIRELLDEEKSAASLAKETMENVERVKEKIEEEEKEEKKEEKEIEKIEKEIEEEKEEISEMKEEVEETGEGGWESEEEAEEKEEE